MKDAIIDFETFYHKKEGITVTALGNRNYAARADAYIVGAVIGDEAMCGTLKEMGPTCEQIAADSTLRPVAANANFDQTFWDKTFPKTKRPWFCALDQGVVAQNPRALSGFAKNVLGIDVDKNTRVEMDGVDFFTLDEAGQEKVQNYCMDDCIITRDVIAKAPPMSSFEAAVAEHTRMMNRRGVLINVERVAEDKTKLEKMRFEAMRAIPWTRDSKPLSYPALKKYCVANSIPVPVSTAKTDEDCAELISDHPKLAEIIGQMRRFRRANTLIKKIETLMARVDPETNELPLEILYCGAPHTRRFSSKGFNVQNLDKEPLATFGDKGQNSWEDIVSGKAKVEGLEWVWSRMWIVPRPGYKFLVLDYAQIEPRCLNWLVGNETMMAALREGFSYYESYARAAKGWKGAPGTLKKEFGKERYTKLKNECLGCGYGMGPNKYTSYAKVPEDEAKAVVTGFRKTNPLVVKFWRTLDNLIISACRDRAKHLAVEMPTGEFLNHFHLRSSGKNYQSYTIRNDFTFQSMQPRLWGGTLTENVCQRMSRDLLCAAILNLEAAGLRVVFHAHDEVILEVPVDKLEESKQTAVRIMQQAPEWAPDIPLGVEGDFADAYTK